MSYHRMNTACAYKIESTNHINSITQNMSSNQIKSFPPSSCSTSMCCYRIVFSHLRTRHVAQKANISSKSIDQSDQTNQRIKSTNQINQIKHFLCLLTFRVATTILSPALAPSHEENTSTVSCRMNNIRMDTDTIAEPSATRLVVGSPCSPPSLDACTVDSAIISARGSYGHRKYSRLCEYFF